MPAQQERQPNDQLKRKVFQALGLMSGTSLDGIDVAAIHSDGAVVTDFGATFFRPYSDVEKRLLRAALAEAPRLQSRNERTPLITDAEALVTKCHIEAVHGFLTAHNMRASEFDLIGFHGQTIFHKPEARLTIQIGDGARLANETGINTIYDLRAADVAAGGQGAPLVPIYHQALVMKALQQGALELPTMVVNIGGVSNVTYVGQGGELLACDTGPGNALLDDFMFERTGIAFDKNGETAKAGHVHGEIVEAFLKSKENAAFFAQSLPKSLDRNRFSKSCAAHLNTNDGAATLTAITVAGIAHVCPMLPKMPKSIILCGGGAHNLTMRNMLAKALPAKILTAEALGWRGDYMEAEAFAFLAIRSHLGLPISFPLTTGAPIPMSGGIYVSHKTEL